MLLLCLFDSNKQPPTSDFQCRTPERLPNQRLFPKEGGGGPLWVDLAGEGVCGGGRRGGRGGIGDFLRLGLLAGRPPSAVELFEICPLCALNHKLDKSRGARLLMTGMACTHGRNSWQRNGVRGADFLCRNLTLSPLSNSQMPCKTLFSLV